MIEVVALDATVDEQPIEIMVVCQNRTALRQRRRLDDGIGESKLPVIGVFGTLMTRSWGMIQVRND